MKPVGLLWMKKKKKKKKVTKVTSPRFRNIPSMKQASKVLI